MKIQLKTDFSKPPKPFQNENGYWYIRQRLAGKDVWRSLKTKNIKEANNIAYSLWYQQQNTNVKNILAIPILPLEIAWEEHIKTDKFDLLAKSTKDTRYAWWTAFLNFSEKRNVHSIQSVTKDMIIDFLEKHSHANKTYNNILSDLKQIFSVVCGKFSIINPCEEIALRTITKGDRASKPYRAFTNEELKNILSGILQSQMRHKDEWYNACKLALYTGLRFKSIALLKWTEITTIDGVKCIEHYPWKTKNKVNKAVLIKISEELENLLNGIPKQSFFILPNLSRKYSEKSSSRYFNDLLERLKIVDDNLNLVGFHSFRTTITTRAKMAGIKLEDFGGVLGHTAIGQTEHYNKAALNIDLSFMSLVNL